MATAPAPPGRHRATASAPTPALTPTTAEDAEPSAQLVSRAAQAPAVHTAAAVQVGALDSACTAVLRQTVTTYVPITRSVVSTVLETLLAVRKFSGGISI